MTQKEDQQNALDQTSVQSESRRNVVKDALLLGGVGAVTEWRKPIVQAVIPPGHARTTARFYCDITNQLDTSGSGLLIASLTPIPPVGSLIRCTITATGTQGTIQTTESEQPTNSQGQAFFTESGFTFVSGFLSFPSGESLLTVIASKDCVNSEECDAECELDITEIVA